MERINSQTILAKRRSKQRKQKLVRGLAIVLALMVIWKFFGCFLLFTMNGHILSRHPKASGK